MEKYQNYKPKIKNGGNWDGEEVDDAKINSKSRFSDGKYRVEILMGDNRGNVNNLVEGNSKKDFFIDNFRPYLKKAKIIKKSNDETRYSKEWLFDETNLTCTGPAINEVLVNGNYTIKFEFSEPVVNPALSINAFDTLTLTSVEPIGNQKNFTVEFVIENEEFKKRKFICKKVER